MARKLIARAVLLHAALGISATAAAQSTADLPLFASQAPLELRISGPFSELWRESDARIEHDFVLEYTEADGSVIPIDIEIRLRGRSRRVNCDYAPLSLDFPTDDVSATEFAGQERIKLVVLCRRSSTYEDYLVQEFLIYRALNLLTDRSFRVRWANVEYVYTDTRRPRSLVAPAFFIEEDWEVAERQDMDVIEQERLEREALDAEHTTLITLFNYMVGNEDWSLTDADGDEPCCHNGKVISADGEHFFVLPYDFDNAGLINAEYAVPSDILRIRSVRQRLYRGFCLFDAELEAAIARINRHRDEILRLFDSERLSNRARRQSVSYLEEYFEEINDPRRLENDVYERCRD